MHFTVTNESWTSEKQLQPADVETRSTRALNPAYSRHLSRTRVVVFRWTKLEFTPVDSFQSNLKGKKPLDKEKKKNDPEGTYRKQ